MQKYNLSSLLPTFLPHILLISLIILSTGCAGSVETNGTSFVTGQIQMVNNEPFARLALINDTSLYLLECSDKLHEMLYNNQGKSVKVYYSSVYKNDEGIKVLRAVNAELLTGHNSN